MQNKNKHALTFIRLLRVSKYFDHVLKNSVLFLKFSGQCDGNAQFSSKNFACHCFPTKQKVGTCDAIENRPCAHN